MESVGKTLLGPVGRVLLRGAGDPEAVKKFGTLWGTDAVPFPCWGLSYWKYVRPSGRGTLQRAFPSGIRNSFTPSLSGSGSRVLAAAEAVPLTITDNHSRRRIN